MNDMTQNYLDKHKLYLKSIQGEKTLYGGSSINDSHFGGNSARVSPLISKHSRNKSVNNTYNLRI